MVVAEGGALLSGGSLVDHGCSFSTDNKYLLCCSGIVIKVFSCATGAQVRQLEGHTDEVTAVAHNPSNVLQACSASLDGCIVLWDLDDALMLRCFCLGTPIAAFWASCSSGDIPLRVSRRGWGEACGLASALRKTILQSTP